MLSVQKVVSESRQFSDVSLVEQSNDWSCNQSWPESNTNQTSNRAIFFFVYLFYRYNYNNIGKLRLINLYIMELNVASHKLSLLV